MTEKDGIAGYVSDHVSFDRIVEDRPTGGHVQVFDMPNHGTDDGVDVVVRDPNEGDGWPVRESYGGFDGLDEAVEFAAEKAVETELPLWDPIESLEHSAAVRERLRNADYDQ